MAKQSIENPKEKQSQSTKEKILAILENESKNQNSISGQEIAEKLNISRAAVWKAINSLREQGFDIHGKTNDGYELNSIFSETTNENDLFSYSLFKSTFEHFFPQESTCHIEVFSTIDSTNSYATRLLSTVGSLRNSSGGLTESGKKYHKAIILSESQSAGRGRMGRTFYSPEKTGIYLSLIYAPKGGIQNPAKITAFSAVAIVRAIKKLYGINASIKWVNDIYLNSKKVAGILTEGFTNFETGLIESCVIGIGINIAENENDFPKDLREIATSIEESIKKTSTLKNSDFSVHGKKISRVRLAAEIVGQVFNILESPNDDSIWKEYKSSSFLIGQTVTVHPIIGDEKNSYEAKVIDIDKNAGLVVSLSDNSKRVLSSGEVSLH